MLDLSSSYALDTEVIDDPETPEMPRIAIGRVVTAELTMQVLLLGNWHRRLPDADETSCGVPFRVMTTPPRREVLTHRDGPLCLDCFTGHEMRKAESNDRAAIEREDKQFEEDERKRAEFFASLHKKRGDR